MSHFDSLPQVLLRNEDDVHDRSVPLKSLIMAKI